MTELPEVIGPGYIEIGDNFRCGGGVRMEAWDRYGEQRFHPEIRIGSDVTLTDRCYLSCTERIEIGDGTLLGRDVFITDNSHGDRDSLELPPKKRPLTGKGPVRIGKNVWIGRQVTVLSGVTVGEHAVIGANSVVNRDIPAYCLAAGNPAKVIRRMKEAPGEDETE